MKLYTVVVEDRHCDIGVEVFSDREEAIRYAKGICKEFARYPEDIKEVNQPAWEYLCYFSGDEDCVSVRVKILDAMKGEY